MSEDTKEYFNFGTRFPYTTKSQENGWVEILETQDTINATKVYEYGDDSALNNDYDFVSYTVDSDGKDAKTIEIEKVLRDLGLSGKIYWKHSNGNGIANKVGKSVTGAFVATSGNINTAGAATSRYMHF